MKTNTPIWVAIIGAAGVVVASLVNVFLSPTQAISDQSSNSVASSDTSSNENFTRRPLSVDFSPSGWMGDAELGERHLTAKLTSTTIEGVSRDTICFTYIGGSKGWAGVYWLHPKNNWGSAPGTDLQGAAMITFFARGQNGGEIVEFISGGIEGKNYSDTYRISTGQLPLSSQWTNYSFDIQNYDLSSVIGAFAWSAPGIRTQPIKFCVAELVIR